MEECSNTKAASSVWCGTVQNVTTSTYCLFCWEKVPFPRGEELLLHAACCYSKSDRTLFSQLVCQLPFRAASALLWVWVRPQGRRLLSQHRDGGGEGEKMNEWSWVYWTCCSPFSSLAPAIASVTKTSTWHCRVKNLKGVKMHEWWMISDVLSFMLQCILICPDIQYMLSGELGGKKNWQQLSCALTPIQQPHFPPPTPILWRASFPCA